MSINTFLYIFGIYYYDKHSIIYDNTTIMLPSQKVALNTGIMYAKMVLTIGITLYSTRIVLNELGAEDFGIFNVVAGIITMLSFLNAAMSTSIRRYLSNALGLGDINLLAKVFQSSIKLHYVLGFISIIAFELVGYFLFNGFLNITPEKISAAYFVFHCMVISTFFSIIAIPYTAAINSHEDIYVLSLIFTLEAICKLGIAIYLQYTPFNKLITYGLLLALTYSLTTIIQKVYCYNKYSETRINTKIEKSIYKSLIHFSGWSSLSYISKLISDQGIVVIINIFGGTIVNAAYGIATQVNGQMSYFSSSLLQAIEPQIMKSEGAGNSDRMLTLSILTCKLSFFLISLFSIPILLKLPYILELWLKDVPEYTVIFCKIILISTIISQSALGLQSGIYAKGDIKKYQCTISIIQLFTLPLAIILIKCNFPIYVTAFTFIIIEITLYAVRLHFAKLNIKLSVYLFIRKVTLPSIISLALCTISIHYISALAPNGLLGFIIICFISFMLYIILFSLFTLNKIEKNAIHNIIKLSILKLKNK